MPSTHTSLHYHVTFSTKSRVPLIAKAWRYDLHGYLGGALKGLGAVPLQIGGVEDHIHLLFGLKASHALADVVRELKKASTAWIHDSFEKKFQWQEGYGGFTVGRREVPSIVQYIQGQEEHHRVKTFQEEYIEFLEEHGIAYDDRFLW